MILLIFGACVVYVDICVDQVHPMLSAVSMPRWALTLIITGIVFCLSLLNSIAALSIPAAVGSLTMLYAAAMVLRNCVSGASLPDPQISSDHNCDQSRFYCDRCRFGQKEESEFNRQ